MKKKSYYEYLKSAQWKAKRAMVLERDGYRCQRCGSTLQLNVHHLTYDRIGNERLSDLVTLCRFCHRKEHNLDGGNWLKNWLKRLGR